MIKASRSQRAVLGKSALILLTTLLALAGCDQPANPPQTGGAAGSSEDQRRFQFVRASKLILRLDTRLGVVWKVAANGDGGWGMLGATPDDDDEPSGNGRYGLFALKSGIMGGPPQLLRVDRATGRSWLALAKDGSRWTPVQEGSNPEPDADSEEESNAQDGPISLQVAPKETIESLPGEESEKIAVVVRALEKEGLAVEIKVWGARQLAVFSPDAAIPPLLKALGSEHPQVVVAAIQSLKEIGRPSAIPKILALSQHPDPDVRAAVQAVVVAVP
ncbi:MAG TPA: HEAT repeat domain-containing protein [Myxococcales bacterium]|nr:HEAT repeat domain-containing protein [Myxococcales bacterium]